MPSCREIITIAMGQCGNQLNATFWDMVCKEHGLNSDGTINMDTEKGGMTEGDFYDSVLDDKLGVYMERTGEVGSRKYTPRAVQCDMEEGTLDMVRNGKIKDLLKPENFVAGTDGAGNNWAMGHYGPGAELIEDVLDLVRKEYENCNSCQGFQIEHSLGGGTGSGMGTLLLLKLRDAYPDRLTTTYSVYPSTKVSNVVTEPYNAVLACHQLIENADQTYVIDNESVDDITRKKLKMSKCNYAIMNNLIGQVMLGVTSSIRFPGQMNGDIRKLGVNLVPFPRLHFFALSQAPLLSPTNSTFVKLSIQEVTTQCWAGDQMYADVKLTNGKYLTAQTTYRGDKISSQEVDENAAKMQDANTELFVEWIPNNIKTNIVNVAPSSSSLSATQIVNTTAMKDVCVRLREKFDSMFGRKANLHHYKEEGMDEMEFQEAQKNLVDLITEYQDKEDATVGGEEGGEEEE